MKSIFTKLLTTILFLGTSNIALAQSSSLPTGGQWQDDRNARTEWLDQRGVHSVDTVNFILCFVNDFWMPSQVNKGPYRALVNETKCDNGGGDSSVGVKLLSVIAELSTTSDGNTEAKLWIPEDTWDGLAEYFSTFARITVTESPSETNPNGVFEVIWNDIGKQNGIMFFKGRMNASVDGISVHTEEVSGGRTKVDKLVLSGNLNSASGAVLYTDHLGNDVTEELGFNASVTCLRQVGLPETCFERSRTAIGAKRSSWRYGLYDAQGVRYDLPNPSFNIRNADGEWGYANRWGVWTNTTWNSGISATQVSGTGINRRFTYIRIPGELRKRNGNIQEIVLPSPTAITLDCSSECVDAASIAAWERGTPTPNTVNSATYKYEDGVLYLASDSINKTPLITTHQTGFNLSLVDGSNSYSYTSGPSIWQSFSGLRNDDQTFVSFSDTINFTLPSRNATLTFEGHGSINGILSKTFKRYGNYGRVDNLPGDWYADHCQNDGCSWVSDYLIDDEQVSIGGNNYYIQWLQSSVTPAIFSGSTPVDIRFGSVTDLPSTTLPTNVRALIGEIPILPAGTQALIVAGKVAP